MWIWKRWRDEAGIERLRVLQMAWQEKGPVFAKVMRGAVWQLQQDSGASDLVLESQFAGDEVTAVEDGRHVAGTTVAVDEWSRFAAETAWTICGGGVYGGWLSLRP
jgi:hypothetical protein